MILIRKILSLLIILLGIVHVGFTFPIGSFDSGDLWFIGSGIALIFSGFLNLAAVKYRPKSLIGYLAFSSNIICLALFILAHEILQEPQVYVGMYLYLVAVIFTGIGIIKFSKEYKQYTHSKKTGGTNESEVMRAVEVIPMLRIFDKKKAEEFYVDWLGFTVQWEHRFEENLPVYMEITNAGIKIHLTEHHGDCTPGGKVFIVCTGLREYHKKLLSKNYSYNRPGIEDASWGSLCMTVIDPFDNKLLFTEPTEKSD